MRTTAIIVAAGRGIRAGGGTPKQFRGLGGRPVVAITCARLASHPRIDHVLVVIDPADAELIARALPNAATTPGGATRAASVAAGLAAVPEDTTHVLIHDAARPCVSDAVIDRVLAALETTDGAAPGLAVSDALWRASGSLVSDVQSREGLVRAQTPQGFRLAAIRQAHAQAAPDAPDDVQVALAAGLDVTVVEGDEDNIKITRPGDFERAARILGASVDIRTGTGFDVHRLVEGDGVMLCGLRVPHGRALSGHSDADVAMHAITDAIYGALADGDIGRHFPPSDPRWKGADSRIFLEHAIQRAADRGFGISNVDCTIVCEAPKIAPHASAMQTRLSELMGIEADRISVKATTSEGLGFTGRAEGIAAQAVATLVRG